MLYFLQFDFTFLTPGQFLFFFFLSLLLYTYIYIYMFILYFCLEEKSYSRSVWSYREMQININLLRFSIFFLYYYNFFFKEALKSQPQLQNIQILKMFEKSQPQLQIPATEATGLYFTGDVAAFLELIPTTCGTAAASSSSRNLFRYEGWEIWVIRYYTSILGKSRSLDTTNRIA